MNAVQTAKALVNAGLTQAQAVAIVQANSPDLPTYVAGLSRPGLKATIIERLLAMIPEPEQDPLDAQLAALLGADLPNPPSKSKSKQAKPSKPTASKLQRKSPPKRTTKGDTIRHDWNGQPPLSESTGKTLPWVVSAGVTENGTYLNIGWRGLRSIGATLDVWREVLANADELLADLEAFADSID
jgi:hypothetical protein